MKIVIFMCVMWTIICYMWNTQFIKDKLEVFKKEVEGNYSESRLQRFNLWFGNPEVPIVIGIIAVLINYFF